MFTTLYRNLTLRLVGNDDTGSQMVGMVISLLVLIAVTAIALPYFMSSSGSGEAEEADTALEMAEETAEIADNNSALREEQYEDLDLDVTYTN